MLLAVWLLWEFIFVLLEYLGMPADFWYLRFELERFYHTVQG